MILAVGLMACESEVEDTTVEDEEGTEAATGEIEVPTDTVWNHTVTIVYNGSSATVTIGADSVTYSVDGGDVTIKSQARNVEYTASGSGTGSLKIYSDYRYKLTLNNLTLTSSGKPVINNQGKKSLFLTLAGTSTLSDSNGYATETSDKEDQKGAIFSEGQVFILGDGQLTLAGKNKHALASDDYILMQSGTITITAAATDGVHTNDAFQMDGGTLTIKSSDEGIAVDEGTVAINGGNINITTSGTSAKGIKSYSDLAISGGTTIVSALGGSGESGSEGIESKAVLTISGGQVVVNSYDDGINAGGDLTISGGYVYANATKNDGIDANGNCYIKGGVIFAVGSGNPEMAIDANSEEQKKLYVTGGVLFTIGGLESGASLTQACYSASSWTKDKWYSMTIGNDTYAFKTPSSGGSTLVVSGSSQPTVKSGVTVSDGTAILNGNAYINASVSNG
ncbi:MAG: carbohydrate-binding domain-containing protein, partial [Paludibacteraceae bacterium]|nr:carbohydrate-binding domain-containing protein [Paludibacteraceae bacterium]